MIKVTIILNVRILLDLRVCVRDHQDRLDDQLPQPDRTESTHGHAHNVPSVILCVLLGQNDLIGLVAPMRPDVPHVLGIEQSVHVCPLFSCFVPFCCDEATFVTIVVNNLLIMMRYVLGYWRLKRKKSLLLRFTELREMVHLLQLPYAPEMPAVGQLWPWPE